MEPYTFLITHWGFNISTWNTNYVEFYVITVEM